MLGRGSECVFIRKDLPSLCSTLLVEFFAWGGPLDRPHPSQRFTGDKIAGATRFYSAPAATTVKPFVRVATSVPVVRVTFRAPGVAAA